MNIEYEATFPNINKNEVRERLKKAEALLVRSEYLQKRSVFNLPTGHDIPGGWLRVRDEGDKVTMSLKIVDGDKIEDQKETCITVNSFEDTVSLLKMIGCQWKAFQESRRELWKLEGVEITIDEWPFLEPFVEVEGKSETEVKRISSLIGFDYAQAVFGTVDVLYKAKYNITEEFVNKTSRIVFDGENPFPKKV